MKTSNKKTAFTLAEGATHVVMSDNIRRYAFTLAEVLITLAIIGVVAVLTVPTLISKYQVKQTVTSLKTFYSTINEAYRLALVDNGPVNTWEDRKYNQGSEKANEILFSILKPYLKVSKDCGSKQGCFPTDVIYKKLDGKYIGQSWDSTAYIYKFQLANGMSVFLYNYGNQPIKKNDKITSYAAISVDINGITGPNVYGRDMFSFLITDNAVMPLGNPDFYGYYTDENGENTPYNALEGCNRKDCVGQCEDCAAWVIINGNMDYLDCDDLSWNGKRKCSD